MLAASKGVPKKKVPGSRRSTTSMAHKGASGWRSVAREHTAARCRTDKVARAASKKPLHQGHVAGVLHLDGLCGMSVHVAWRHAPKGVVSVHTHPSVHGRPCQRGTTAARADAWLRGPHMNSRAWRGAACATQPLRRGRPCAHHTGGLHRSHEKNGVELLVGAFTTTICSGPAGLGHGAGVRTPCADVWSHTSIAAAVAGRNLNLDGMTRAGSERILASMQRVWCGDLFGGLAHELGYKPELISQPTPDPRWFLRGAHVRRSVLPRRFVSVLRSDVAERTRAGPYVFETGEKSC